MADVYGFDESKSKIQVVDKATQDAKDAEQDGKLITGITPTVDSDNNLKIALTKGDGSSMEGSVTLPSGGEIAVEYYGGGDESALNRSLIPIQTGQTNGMSSSSITWNILKFDGTTVYDDSLYYDLSENVFKRCMKQQGIKASSGTLSTTYASSSRTYYTSMAGELGEALIGQKVAGSGTSIYLRVASSVVFELGVTIENNAITKINTVTGYSRKSTGYSVDTTAYNIQWLYKSTDTDPLVPVTEGDFPSTYKLLVNLA